MCKYGVLRTTIDPFSTLLQDLRGGDQRGCRLSSTAWGLDGDRTGRWHPVIHWCGSLSIIMTRLYEAPWFDSMLVKLITI